MIVYEDNHLLLVEKKAGQLTQASGLEEESLETYWKKILKKRDGKPGGVFLHAIHRLDRPVSGLVLFAKSKKALVRLNAAMRAGQCRKYYRAIVHGRFEKKEGLLEHFLRRGDHCAILAEEGDLEAKRASLRYHVVDDNDAYSLVDIELITGRYHQIRLQMSAIGHPIVGDSKYGSNSSFNNGAIALHHRQFSCPHPTLNKVMCWESETPLLFSAFF